MEKEFIKTLKEFVEIKSISTDPKYQKDIEKAASWVFNYAKKSGLVTEIIRGFENPIIIAKTLVDPKFKTIFIYGHYDVVPGSFDLFNLKTQKGKIYGRGTADNKGQILIHLYSVIKLFQENMLRFNIVFLIEGNEETGSYKLNKFLERYREKLKPDCIIVSDSVLAYGNKPTLQKSFRGATSVEVILETAKDEMHSGLFGGVAPNAAEELGKIVGNLTNFVGRKNIYSPNTKAYEKRRGLEATAEVTSLLSGYIGNGFKNSIPCKAIAKVNLRSAPSQNIKSLVNNFKKFVLKKCPKYVQIKFKDGVAIDGMSFSLNNQFAKQASEILREVYKGELVTKNGGGTLPVCIGFRDILQAPQVLIPLANEDCGAHSASENMSLECIEKGLKFSSRFFSK